MPQLDALNRLAAARATELFTACCGSTRWVADMVARRPFPSRTALLSAADEIWRSLGPDDWREAFRHHPRIGESAAAVAQSRQGSEWSAGEQRGADRASDSLRRAQKDMNAEYERRFGFIYIVCATGKTPDEMLAIARDRLANEPDTELRVAAEEQRKIMRLRLEKLLDQPETT